MIFFTVAFNDEYIPYLKVLIESINRNVPNSQIFVGYDGLSYLPKRDNVIYLTYKFNFKLNDSAVITPGRKLSFLMKFVEYWSCKKFVFIDCDMLVLKSFDNLFNENFNIGYTYKTCEDEGLQYLLNTGITLYKDCPLSFFYYWKCLTDEIQSNLELNQIARQKWGAADQAALADIIGGRDLIGDKIIYDKGVGFKGFPCKLINETRCTAITDETHVIHYKSGWRSVLKTGIYTNNRPKIKCEKMYNLWFEYLNSFDNSL
jgi:lipopolysaccharide biosynthesis glycosyltransferase